MKSNLTHTEIQPMKIKGILRRALFGLGLFLLCFSSKAEGWLLFGNNSSTARVFERDPLTLQLSLVPTNGGKVEFLYAVAGSTDLNLFQTVAGKSPVPIMPVPGVFFGGTYRLTDIEPGAVVSAVVRGWTGSFSTWDEALNSGTAKVGISSIFLVDTTDPTEIPPPLPASILTSVPGQGFTGLILEVPEPSSLALAGLCATSLLVLRRRPFGLRPCPRSLQLGLSALLALGITLPSLGQGTLWFNNTSSTLVILDIGPNPAHPAASSENVWVEFLWAPLGTTDWNFYQVVGPAVHVGIPTAGRFAGGTRTIPAGMGFGGIAPGDVVSAMVRGWIGSDYATASFRDVSAFFTVDTGDPTLLPAGTPGTITSSTATPFTGLVISIPEPSSMALAGLGAASLLIFRRRK